MRTLLFHVSSLIGLLVFLNQLWNSAEIERPIFIALTTGLAIYVVLMFGYVVAHRILSHVSKPSIHDHALHLIGKGSLSGSANAETEEHTNAEHEHASKA